MAKLTTAHDTVRRAVRCAAGPHWLVNPESVKAGMGPTCRCRAEEERRRNEWMELTLFDLPPRQSA